MFWLHEIGILREKTSSVQLWAWRLVYLLDITYSKIIENVILVDFFNLILSSGSYNVSKKVS